MNSLGMRSVIRPDSASEAEGMGAQLGEVCVVCYRVRFNEALLPFIFGAVCESRE